MRKNEELSNPDSCMSRANPDEMTFVLLGRDVCAPEVIRYWANARIVAGKNRRSDLQIQEALHCAAIMERECTMEHDRAQWSPCVICGDNTPLACSDCRIDTGKSVHVCSRSVCRRKHEETYSGRGHQV